MKVYVASSWRNEDQPGVVRVLRENGYEVYDFRNPDGAAPSGARRGDTTAFDWTDIDTYWKEWTEPQFIAALQDPRAKAGFAADMRALQESDVVVLVLPCGRSAHLEAGWAKGAGKKLIIIVTRMEPELMYKMADHVCYSLLDVLPKLKEWAEEIGG